MIHFYRAIFWIAAAFAFVIALIPLPQLPGAPSDKIQHIVAFAALAALAAAAYPTTSLIGLIAALSAFGAFIEVLQASLALNRDGDPVDWLADTIAVAIVLAVAWWWRSLKQSEN